MDSTHGLDRHLVQSRLAAKHGQTASRTKQLTRPLRHHTPSIRSTLIPEQQSAVNLRGRCHPLDRASDEAAPRGLHVTSPLPQVHLTAPR